MSVSARRELAGILALMGVLSMCCGFVVGKWVLPAIDRYKLQHQEQRQ